MALFSLVLLNYLIFMLLYWVARRLGLGLTFCFVIINFLLAFLDYSVSQQSFVVHSYLIQFGTFFLVAGLTKSLTLRVLFEIETEGKTEEFLKQFLIEVEFNNRVENLILGKFVNCSNNKMTLSKKGKRVTYSYLALQKAFGFKESG